MPVYTFICPVCGDRFEERLSLQDRDQHVFCSHGHPARRIFSPPTVVFKGSGFYSTDHRKARPTESGD